MLTIFLSLTEILLPLFINILSMCLYFHLVLPELFQENGILMDHKLFFSEKATFRLFVSCKWKYE